MSEYCETCGGYGCEHELNIHREEMYEKLRAALAERDAEIDQMSGWFARLYDYAASATSEGLWFGANQPPETPAAFCDWLVSLWGNANSWKSRAAMLEAQYRHDHEASPDDIDRCRLCHLGVRDPIHHRKEAADV